MISSEDQLRIIAVLQAELGNADLAGVLFSLAETLGVEGALLELNRVLAGPRLQDERPPS